MDEEMGSGSWEWELGAGMGELGLEAGIRSYNGELRAGIRSWEWELRNEMER